MKYIRLQLLPLILLVIQSGTAQDDYATALTNEKSILIQDAEHFIQTGIEIVTAPARFSWADWSIFGTTLAGTGLFQMVDRDVIRFARVNPSSLNDFVFGIDNYHGNQYSVLFAWAVYGYGAINGEGKIRKIGLHAVEAFVYAGAITGVIKLLAGRRRPYAGDNHLFFRPFQVSDNTYQALPSGHSAVSMAVSTVMAKSVDNLCWKIFWYSSASLVAAARIYHQKHWLSDVFLGAMIGYSVGDFVIERDQSSHLNESNPRIQPYISPYQIGLRIQF